MSEFEEPKLSNCCGVEPYNDDSDICPKCKEHCEFVAEEEDDDD